MAPRADGPAGRLDHGGWRDGLDEDVDRAAAGQSHVPRLLVTDAITDDPRVAGLPGAGDLLGRCALDAAAAHGPGDPAIRGVQEDGALWPRGGPERADDDGASHGGARRPVGGPGRERVEQFLHLIGLGADGSMVSPPTTEGGPTTTGPAVSGSAACAAASLPRRVSPARTPPRISPSRSSDATVPAGRKSSM